MKRSPAVTLEGLKNPLKNNLDQMEFHQPFEGTGGRDQLPPYEKISDSSGIWTIAKTLANTNVSSIYKEGQCGLKLEIKTQIST